MHFTVLGTEIGIYDDVYGIRPRWVIRPARTPAAAGVLQPIAGVAELNPTRLALVRALLLAKGRPVSTGVLQSSLWQDVDGETSRVRLILKESLDPQAAWIPKAVARSYRFNFDERCDTLDKDVCHRELDAAARSAGLAAFDEPLLISGGASDQVDDSRRPRTCREAICAWDAILGTTVLTNVFPQAPPNVGSYLWADQDCRKIRSLRRSAQRLRLMLYDHDGDGYSVLQLAEELRDLSEDTDKFDDRVSEAAVRAAFPASATRGGGVELIHRWITDSGNRLTPLMQQFKNEIDVDDPAEQAAACARWRQRFDRRQVELEPPPPKAPTLPGRLAEPEYVPERLTWEHVEEGVRRLVDDIAGWRPELIVGINRGGAIVGGMLAKRLQIRTISCIALVSAHSSAALNAIQLPQADPAVERLLLVDEAMRHGFHCLAALNYLRHPDFFPDAEIRTAMLVDVGVPDRYCPPPDHFPYSGERYVCFPWDM